MKANRLFGLAAIVAAIAISMTALSLAGCGDDSGGGGGGGGDDGWKTPNATPLTENQWAKGNLPTESSVQWFSFTATATQQNFHFKLNSTSNTYNYTYGYISYFHMQVYDSSGTTVKTYGGGDYLDVSYQYEDRQRSLPLTENQTYYIKTFNGSMDQPDDPPSGTFWIAFNTSTAPRPTP